MKKLILSLVAIATISLSSFGQAPEGFKYQAVVRDAGNTILNNQAVGMRMTIQQGSIGGTTVYQETFAPTTNAYGLVNLEIGSGTVVSGDFTTIDWANGPYFIETAVDVTGGTSYAVMGTSQLMSVPYALHAKTAENVTNDMVDDADADPTNELQDWSNLPNIPLDFSDNVDNVDDADNDPLNEIELPSGGLDGQVLRIVGGQPAWACENLAVGSGVNGGILIQFDPVTCSGLVMAPASLTTQDQANSIVYCQNLVYNGYSDWYAPSQSELELIYNIPYTLNYGNILPSEWYWSSDLGIAIFFNDPPNTPFPQTIPLSSSHLVIPVRAF